MQGNNLIPAVIVDIDGTVALRGDRDPYDWANVINDKPNEPVILAVAGMWLLGYHLLFVSGRMEQCRRATALWLQRQHLIENHLLGDGHGEAVKPEYGSLPGWKLFMRPDGDMRPDDELKSEIYEKHILGTFDVKLVFDDRNKVVKMWREKHELTVLQVAEGNF